MQATDNPNQYIYDPIVLNNPKGTHVLKSNTVIECVFVRAQCKDLTVTWFVTRLFVCMFEYTWGGVNKVPLGGHASALVSMVNFRKMNGPFT